MFTGEVQLAFIVCWNKYETK